MTDLNERLRLIESGDARGGLDWYRETAKQARAALEAKEREIAALTSPIADRSSCQQCGRRDGLDAVVPNFAWDKISAASGGKNILCLWCMDSIAAELGIKLAAALHFAGRALFGGSDVRFAECIEIASRSALRRAEAAESQLATVRREVLDEAIEKIKKKADQYDCMRESNNQQAALYDELYDVVDLLRALQSAPATTNEGVRPPPAKGVTLWPRDINGKDQARTIGAITFLRELAVYFERRGDGGEDRRFWSNKQNSENSNAIAELIERRFLPLFSVPPAKGVTEEVPRLLPRNIELLIDAWAGAILEKGHSTSWDYGDLWSKLRAAILRLIQEKGII